MKKLLCILSLIALTGCSSTNISKLVQALAKDPSTSVVKITTIYGNVSYTRVGLLTNETASVAADGSVILKSGTHQ